LLNVGEILSAKNNTYLKDLAKLLNNFLCFHDFIKLERLERFSENQISMLKACKSKNYLGNKKSLVQK